MTKKVLLTGSKGFIGFNLCMELLARGVAVTGIDNDYDDGDLGIKRRRASELSRRENFRGYDGSITDRRFLEGVFERNEFDVAIHLAALAGVRSSTDKPHLFLDTNFMGTLNVLDLCRQQKVGKLLFASSSSTYGLESDGFSKERDGINCPLSIYAASKGAAEQICYAYNHLHKIDVGVMRFFTVYGQWGRPNMLILMLIKRIEQGEKVSIFGTGEATRTYIYVDDLVRGIGALLHKGAGYQTFNFAGREKSSVNTIINLVERALGKKADIVNLPADPSDAFDSSGDISHAKEVLGWQPEVSIEAGIEKTVRWYMDNRDWLVDAIPPANA